MPQKAGAYRDKNAQIRWLSDVPVRGVNCDEGTAKSLQKAGAYRKTAAQTRWLTDVRARGVGCDVSGAQEKDLEDVCQDPPDMIGRIMTL